MTAPARRSCSCTRTSGAAASPVPCGSSSASTASRSKPGDAATVTFTLQPAILAYYDVDMNLVVTPGEVQLMAGPSSATLPLTTTFRSRVSPHVAVPDRPPHAVEHRLMMRRSALQPVANQAGCSASAEQLTTGGTARTIASVPPAVCTGPEGVAR